MKKITDYFNRENTRANGNNVKIHPEDVYILMFDGGSRGNPGISGAGFVIYKNDTEILAGCEPLGHATNNFAEYRALELGLDCAINKGITNLIIKGDSQLVLNQVTNKWIDYQVLTRQNETLTSHFISFVKPSASMFCDKCRKNGKMLQAF